MHTSAGSARLAAASVPLPRAPASVVAAAERPAGGIFAWWQAALAAALALTTFGLARGWRREHE
jgi:hypothetical protein